MAEIKLCGYNLLVDEEDVERILARPWSCNHDINALTFISRYDSKRCTLARFVMLSPPGMVTQHKPGVSRVDYRKESLQVVNMKTRTAAAKKRNIGRIPTSQYKGVSRDARSGLWRASIRPSGQSFYLGQFATEAEAAIAYNRAALIYFGDEAYQNEIVLHRYASIESASVQPEAPSVKSNGSKAC
ncbi:MAG: hypothetical protein EOP06_01355 [Proteobacteria bacterium]|nr:MAG: hypothetical protein EOP06_01355 [Pseudomonadota bacterium]